MILSEKIDKFEIARTLVEFYKNHTHSFKCLGQAHEPGGVMVCYELRKLSVQYGCLVALPLLKRKETLFSHCSFSMPF